MKRYDRIATIIMLFMGTLLMVGLVVWFMSITHTFPPRIISPSTADAIATNSSAVTVEEVYRDARVSVYRLVDHANGVACYWTYQGNVSCMKLSQ